MNKPKYKIGDRISLQIENGTMLKIIKGKMENYDDTGWMYCFYVGINYRWQPFWVTEEYLDLYGKLYDSTKV